jgi:hypothetical protein
MAYPLFILVNAILIIRPSEIFAELYGVELYFYAIALCAVVAVPEVIRYLTAEPIEKRAVTLCVFAILVFAVLSPLSRFNGGEAAQAGSLFGKVVVFFLLFVSIINTPARLKGYIGWVVGLTAVVVCIAVLDYHEIIQLPHLQTRLLEGEEDHFGISRQIARLQFSGIFQDPNELCVWLAALLPLCLYVVVHDTNVLKRVVALAAALLFLYGIYLTKSRGGLLALLAGLGAWSLAEFGWKKSLVLGAVGLPVLLALFAGRQTSFDMTNSTGQTRVQLWSDWFYKFRGNPAFGEGMSLKSETATLQSEAEHRLLHGLEHLAHNSYLQAFADLGILGGTVFLGAFYLAVVTVYRAGRHRALLCDPATRRMQPYILGTVTAYAVGLATLSLCYVVPTFIILGLAAAYPAAHRAVPPAPPVRFDLNLAGRLALCSAAFLVGIYVFIRLFVNWA